MLHGIITSIVHGPISAEVGLLVNDRIVLDVLVTNSSVDELGLSPGGTAIALIKSTFVMLAEDIPGLRISARNQVGGQVSDLISGPVETEVIVDIGGGQQIAAIVTSQSVQEMMLMRGTPILCCFKASHIILAVED